jgi:hypothetical protein
MRTTSSLTLPFVFRLFIIPQRRTPASPHVRSMHHRKRSFPIMPPHPPGCPTYHCHAVVSSEAPPTYRHHCPVIPTSPPPPSVDCRVIRPACCRCRAACCPAAPCRRPAARRSSRAFCCPAARRRRRAPSSCPVVVPPVALLPLAVVVPTVVVVPPVALLILAVVVPRLRAACRRRVPTVAVVVRPSKSLYWVR